MSTVIQQYSDMVDKHQDFVQSMLAIADKRKDVEMLQAISDHMNELDEILKVEPQKAKRFSIRDSFGGMYSPSDIDRENNPSLHSHT